MVYDDTPKELDEIKVICVKGNDELVKDEEYIVIVISSGEFYMLKKEGTVHHKSYFKTIIELRQNKIRKLYLKTLPWYKKIFRC